MEDKTLYEKNKNEILIKIAELKELINTLDAPKNSEKTPKKRQPRKAKTVEKKETQEEIITLNMDAAISYHNCEDRGCGKIEFENIE
jgi:hypothetical protein